MRRYHIQLLCVLLLAGLSACRPAATDHDSNPFDFWTVDSLRRALEAQELTGRDMAVASGILGLKYITIGQYDSARVWLNRALSLPGGREFQGGRFITNLAGSYVSQGEYTEALKIYLEALRENRHWVLGENDFNQTGLNIVRASAGAARMHYLTGNLDEALHYALQAKAIDEIHGWHYISPQYLYILGSVHLDRGEIDDARDAMQLTLKISEDIAREHVERSGQDSGMYFQVARGHMGLARVALASGDYADALEQATEALDYAERNGGPAVIADVLSVFSDIHLAQGNYEEGGEFARRAQEASPDHHKVNPDVLFNSAAAHLHGGRRAEAYEDFADYAAHMRANTENQFRQTLAGMEVVYETEKRDARITTLEKQRRLYALIGVAGGLFLLTLCVVLMQRIRHERQKRRLAAANAVIEWEKRERKRFAGDLHDGINGMLSAVKFSLASTHDASDVTRRLDECIETIRRMARGMMPASLERYGLRSALEDYCRLFPGVKFHFHGDERRLDEKLELTIYYCAHELVGNAFRHSGASAIDVQLYQDATLVSLTVEDNGRGFDPDATPAASDGAGLQNLRDRIASVGGTIDIVSRPGRGTEINIEIDTK